jgi:CDP-diacylglycerol--glycerol-3-phosphate 3-phosphatidyltransferase
MQDDKAIRRGDLLTIPNMLSLTRVLIVVPELYFALAGNKIAFLALVGFALFTDSIDGPIARRLRQDSVTGAKLDSLGDLATYATMPICGWLLWPDIIIREKAFVIAAVLSYMLPVLVGLAKYRRVTSYHTWGAKASAVLMGAGVLILFLDWSPWPFRIFTPVAALAGIEETAMTMILRNWHANVPTILHALRIRAGEQAEAPR